MKPPPNIAVPTSAYPDDDLDRRVDACLRARFAPPEAPAHRHLTVYATRSPQHEIRAGIMAMQEFLMQWEPKR